MQPERNSTRLTHCCLTADHFWEAWAIVVLIGDTIIAPLAILAFLYINREKIHANDTMMQRKFGVLYE